MKIKKIIIGLGIFSTIGVGYGLTVNQSIDNAINYIKKIVFTTDGTVNGIKKVIIDGTNGNLSMSGDLNVKGKTIINGNVGIGITSPGAKLDVNGSIKTNSELYVHNWTRHDQNTGIYWSNNGFHFYPESSQRMRLRSGNSNNVDLKFLDKENTAYGRVYGAGNGADFGLLDGDGNRSYHAHKDSYTSFSINNSEKMRINSNGNVGIGTTSPGAKLDVRGDIQLNNSNLTQVNEIQINDPGEGVVFKGNTDGDIEIKVKDDSHDNLLGIIGPNSMKVGIGTTSPRAQLEVANKNDGFRMGDIRIHNTNEINNLNGNLYLQYRGGKNIVLNKGGGNVGIGITSPGAKLDVNGSIKTNSELYVHNRTRHDQNTGIYWSNNGFHFYPESSQRMRLRSGNSNNVDLKFLDKENTAYGRVYGAGNGADFGLLDGDGNRSYHAHKDSYTSFAINNSEKMRINSNGNVGIGTTSPGAKLDVRGDIKTNSDVYLYDDLRFTRNKARTIVDGKTKMITEKDGPTTIYGDLKVTGSFKIPSASFKRSRTSVSTTGGWKEKYVYCPSGYRRIYSSMGELKLNRNSDGHEGGNYFLSNYDTKTKCRVRAYDGEGAATLYCYILCAKN